MCLWKILKKMILPLQYVFYNNSCSEYLLDDLDDMYIAMKTQYSALIPRFMFLSTEAEMKYTYVIIFKEKIVLNFMIVRLIFPPDRHSIFHKILTVSTWNFQLLRFTIMGFIQRLMSRKLPCFPTHRLMIAFISTTEYRTVT